MDMKVNDGAPAHQTQSAVKTEIIRQALVAITEEMKANLMRTAYNVIIYEIQDFTVGLFDAKGDIVSIGIGLPMFIRGMSDAVKAKIKHYGMDGIHPGDVLLTNDAYITGSHLNHMTFSVPIFHEGEIIAFSACMAHWPDVGGTLDGMTTDIYSEGLQMPIVKAFRGGVESQEIISILEMNVRLPHRAMGDMRAQIAAVMTGERRFQELLAKHGRDDIVTAITTIMNDSERAARENVLSIPDGVYEAESYMDDDGVSHDKRIPIRVKVIVFGDEMTVDLTDVGEQVKGFYNSGEAAGFSCCQVAFKCLTSPTDLPINEGSFRPLKVILPPGRVVSALKPAPMRWWMTFPMTVVDTIFKALSQAIPDRVIAGHHADLVSAAINGRHKKDNSVFIMSGGIGGGWGAKHNEDGVCVTIAINDGDTHNVPTEHIEAKFPLLVERYALRQDSGGPGQFRGGLGAEKIIRAIDEIMFNAQVDRVHCRPWGLNGGLSGAGNEVSIIRGEDRMEKRFGSGKVLGVRLAPGDAYVMRSGGGGGYGSPLERPIEDVENDVRQGYISAVSAEEFYGVVVDPETLNVRKNETLARRSAMRSLGLPKDTLPAEHQAPSTISGDPSHSSFERPDVALPVIDPFRNRCC